MEGPNKKSNNNSNNNSNFSPNNKQNLYDLEININSILGFLKGWDITFGKDGKDKYEKAKKNREKIFQLSEIKIKENPFFFRK